MRVINTTPKIAIEFYREGMLANATFVRVFTDQDGDGFEDEKRDTQESIHPNADSDMMQLAAMLHDAGVIPGCTQDQARTWLATTNQEDAVNALLDWWKRVVCPFLAALINRFTAGPPVTAPVPFKAQLDLVNALAARTQITVRADGNVDVTAI